MKVESFDAALRAASKYKKAPLFFNGVEETMTTDNYEPVSEERARELSRIPGVVVIFSRAYGSRPCEIVVQTPVKPGDYPEIMDDE